MWLMLTLHPVMGQKRFLFSTEPDALRKVNLQQNSTVILETTSAPDNQQLSWVISFDDIKRLKSICTDSIILASEQGDIWVTNKKLDELLAYFEHHLDEKRVISIVRIEPLQVKPRNPPKIDLKSISMRIQLNLDPGGFMTPILDDD